MKVIVLMRVLFLVFIEINAVGQSQMQMLFPKTAPSIIMFQKAGISNKYFLSFYETEYWSEPTRLRGSIIPYYKNNFYYTSEIRKSVVAVSLMQRAISRGHLNANRIKINLSKNRVFSPFALPVIYERHQEVKYAANQVLVDPKIYSLKSKVLSNNTFSTQLNSFSGARLSYNKLVKDLYYQTPGKVQIHADALPEAPKLKNGLSSNQRNSRESIGDLLKPDQPKTLDKMESVKLVKKPWKYSGSENIQISQAYVKNWIKGGQDSYSLLSDLRLKEVYSEGKIQWENTGIHKLGYMFLNGGSSGVNDDVLDITSKYGIGASQYWYYSFLFNMKTQFFYGYDRKDVDRENPISGIMAPGYFTLAIGMDFKKGKNFTLMISPVTSKLAVVLDTAKIDQSRYNIPDDKRSTFLTGASLYNNFTWQIKKEIKLTSAMNIFYDYFKKDDNVQSDWDLILDMRINLFLSMRVVANFRYYENESSDIQMRENMSLAFRYNF
jgi:hypothetical protein